MTREDLSDWLQAHNCEPAPIEGINVTGWAIKFINRSNGRYSYLQTPIDDREMPDNVVRKICVDDLWIKAPDCVMKNL